MSCEQFQAKLGPMLDNELPSQERNATIAHVNQCAECARDYERLQALQRRLLTARVQMPRSLPHRVRARIALEGEEGIQQPVKRFFGRARPYLRQAAVLLFACGISASAALWWGRTANDRELIVRDVVSAHVRGLLQDNSVQVASLDTHTVKPWFAGRLDFTPVVKDLTAEGFKLVGGRLDYVGGQRVAVLVYTRQKHHISVFIWPSARETSPIMVAPNGFNLVSWSRSGMTFWAISDLGQAELEELPRHL